MIKKNEIVMGSSVRGGDYFSRAHGALRTYLAREGLSQTHQRDAVLDVLLKAKRHVRLESIANALASRGIGRVTVFRTLKLLEKAGLVDRLTDARGRSVYEMHLQRPHHDHLVCVRCSAIIEVQWPTVELAQKAVCKKLNFKIISHRHEVLGLCQTCQKTP